MDFHTREQVAAKERERQEHDDLQNERAGRETGRIKRLEDLPGTPKYEKKRKEREARETLTQLAALLRDPEYAALYNAVDDALSEQEDRTQAALDRLGDRLDAIERRLEMTGPGAPDAEERKRLEEERLELQRRQQAWLDYKLNVLDPARKRLEDPDNPPSKGELKAIQKQIEENAPRSETTHDGDVVCPDTKGPPSNISVPAI